MKYLKKWNLFFEDVSSSSSGGMGDVSSSQPGALAGTTGEPGSGDIGFTLKKEKRQKGNPSEVSDMRDLETSKEVTQIEESESISRDPNYDALTSDIIDNCVVELYDMQFDLMSTDYIVNSSSEELTIYLNKIINQVWTGNMTMSGEFDESGTISKNTSTLRPSGKLLNKDESDLDHLIQEVAHKLINSLDYQFGTFRISWEVVGPAMPWNSKREIYINIKFSLENNLKE